MSDLDDRIRGALAGLTEAPVPQVPRLRPATARLRTTPPALLAAAAMLILLAGSLFFMPGRARGPEAQVAERIAQLEARIARIENEELRTLMSREVALLRRELELAPSGN